jgi:hypothetical protein
VFKASGECLSSNSFFETHRNAIKNLQGSTSAFKSMEQRQIVGKWPDMIKSDSLFHRAMMRITGASKHALFPRKQTNYEY